MYLATFLAVLSTAVLPVPEEATLLAAGWLARSGRISALLAIVVAWAAVFIGDVGTFTLGRGPLHRLLASRWGARLLPGRWRGWAERLVERRGWRAIVIARFLVGLRGFVYVALGASGYRWLRFVVIDGAVGLVEVGGVVALGYLLGTGPRVERRIEAVDIVACVVLALAFVAPWLIRKLVGRRAPAPPRA